MASITSFLLERRSEWRGGRPAVLRTAFNSLYFFEWKTEFNSSVRTEKKRSFTRLLIGAVSSFCFYMSRLAPFRTSNTLFSSSRVVAFFSMPIRSFSDITLALSEFANSSLTCFIFALIGVSATSTSNSSRNPSNKPRSCTCFKWLCSLRWSSHSRAALPHTSWMYLHVTHTTHTNASRSETAQPHALAKRV